MSLDELPENIYKLLPRSDNREDLCTKLMKISMDEIRRRAVETGLIGEERTNFIDKCYGWLDQELGDSIDNLFFGLNWEQIKLMTPDQIFERIH